MIRNVSVRNTGEGFEGVIRFHNSVLYPPLVLIRGKGKQEVLAEIRAVLALVAQGTELPQSRYDLDG